MSEARRQDPEPVEPDEPQKRMSGQDGTAGATSDADAAATRRDDQQRPVGSAGGGQYGAKSEEESAPARGLRHRGH
jgi:hypothetical protein